MGGVSMRNVQVLRGDIVRSTYCHDSKELVTALCKACGIPDEFVYALELTVDRNGGIQIKFKTMLEVALEPDNQLTIQAVMDVLSSAKSAANEAFGGNDE